jgi:hypothetical protein
MILDDFFFKNYKINLVYQLKEKMLHENSKISMESKTFAKTSARRYRKVDAEERFMLNF